MLQKLCLLAFNMEIPYQRRIITFFIVWGQILQFNYNLRLFIEILIQLLAPIMCTHTSILIWFGQVHELSPNFVPGEQASSVKIICYLDKLIELVGCHCRECHLPCRIVKRRLFGCSITIRTECAAGHVFMWSSSPVMTNANNAMIYECNMAKWQ